MRRLGWDASADVDVFVDEVLAELEAMARDRARPMRSGPKPPLAGAAQGRRGHLVCFFLWHAVAGNRAAVRRHTIRRALRAVRALDRTSGSVAGCSTGCATRPGGALAGMLWNRAPWSSIVDPVAQHRVALTEVSMVERRSGASKSISPLTNMVSLWRSTVSPANRHDTRGIVPGSA